MYIRFDGILCLKQRERGYVILNEPVKYHNIHFGSPGKLRVKCDILGSCLSCTRTSVCLLTFTCNCDLILICGFVSDYCLWLGQPWLNFGFLSFALTVYE